MEQSAKKENINRHWTENLAQEVVSKKKPPFVISGGMTTSGPAHLGTVCEFLYPAALRDEMEEKGNAVRYGMEEASPFVESALLSSALLCKEKIARLRQEFGKLSREDCMASKC